MGDTQRPSGFEQPAEAAKSTTLKSWTLTLDVLASTEGAARGDSVELVQGKVLLHADGTVGFVENRGETAHLSPNAGLLLNLRWHRVVLAVSSEGELNPQRKKEDGPADRAYLYVDGREAASLTIESKERVAAWHLTTCERLRLCGPPAEVEGSGVSGRRLRVRYVEMLPAYLDAEAVEKRKLLHFHFRAGRDNAALKSGLRVQV